MATQAFDRSAVKSAYLNVTVNGKPATLAVSKMTDDQLRAALARPDNAGALAAGWIRTASGEIAKAPAPTATAPAPRPAAPAPVSGGIGVVPAGTPAPTAAPSMTLADAIKKWGDKPRTFTDAAGNVHRTTAWESFLQQHGLLAADKATTKPATGGGAPKPESHDDPVNTGAGDGIGAPVTAGPAPVAPPPPPKLDDFAQYQDSDYYDSLLGYQRQYDDANADLTSKLSRLNDRGVGGKTLYDLMYERQNQQLARNVSLSRSEAAKRGVVRSGYMDRTLNTIGQQDMDEKDKLVRDYGYEGLKGANGQLDMRAQGNQLASNRTRLQQQFEESKRLLAKSAQQRGLSNAMGQYQQMYAPIGGSK